MKKHTKVVLSRIVASALLVGAMFSNVLANPTSEADSTSVNDTVAYTQDANGKAWGDVDGNGIVDATDGALTLQYTLKPEQVNGFDSTVANVSEGTATGVINAFDAALILQKALDSSFKFPFEKESTESTVYVVGDSTACHYGDTDDVNFYYKRVGFGDKLQNYLTGANVVNLALSGRSSKSFATGINENGAVDDSAVANYTQLKENIKAGDTLIIAWGHNDEKTDSYRFTDPNGDKDTAGSFKNSLYENYIKLAQDKGATPVLCTPIVRRTASGTWGDNDLHVANGGDYAQAIRDLGSELGITVIDSLNNTKNLYDTVGVGTAPKDAENGDSETAAPTGSAAFHATDQGLVVDNTHLNEYGASMVAYMMAKDIKASNISLASNVGDITEPSATMLTRNAGWAKFNEGVWNRPVPAIWKLSSPWEAMAFGSGVSGITEDSHPNHDAVQKDANTFEIVVRNNKGKIAGSEDGMMMVFQEIGANDDFTLTATATVGEGFNATNQIGFGLICRDNMFIADNYKTKADYVTAGYTQQSVGGNSTPIAPFARLNGSLDRSNVLETAPAAGESIELKLTRKDGVYTAQYGNNTPVTYTDVNLAALNADNDYVGMFVSRNADVTFSNVALTINGQGGGDEPTTAVTTEATTEVTTVITTEATTETTTEEPTETTTSTENTVYVVGDSTACHYGDTDDVNFYYKRVGFGDKLQNYLTGANVVNLALSGRSSKSFATGINENGAVDDSAVANYTQLKENIKAGDTLIIAWGHNDEKTDSYRFTDPNGDKDTAGSFKNSLYENYIKLAQDKGATPVLCTPIVRRTASGTWGDNDLHVANGGDYAQAIRDLGSELGITVIDSLNNTKNLYDTVGVGTAPKDAENGDSETAAPTGSAAFHATDQGLVVDNTHLNEYGASMVAYMMAKDIKASNISLASNVGDITEPSATMLTRNAGWAKFNEGVWNRPVPAIWKLSSPWEAMAFGSGVSGITEDSHPNHDAVQKDANTFEIVVRNNKGKIAGSEDGMMMVFQEIGANDDFTLTATATVGEGFNATNQIGFGLICRDNMFIADNYKTKADYVTAGYTQQSVGGNSTPIAPFARLNGSLDRSNVLETAPAAGESIELKLTRKDGVYTAQYGNNTPVTYTDVNLAALNADNDYVGMFVSRNADVTFSNVDLTINGGNESTTELTTESTSEETTLTVAEDTTATATEATTEATTEETTEATPAEATEVATEGTTVIVTEEPVVETTEAPTEETTEETTVATVEEVAVASVEEDTATVAEASTEEIA